VRSFPFLAEATPVPTWKGLQGVRISQKTALPDAGSHSPGDTVSCAGDGSGRIEAGLYCRPGAILTEPDDLGGLAPPEPREAVETRPSRRSLLRLLGERAVGAGWKFHLLLACLTLATTSLAGGGFLLNSDDPFAGSILWPVLLAEEPWRLIRSGLPYGLSVIAILGAHEMGHYLACRYYGVRATPPFFLPFPMMLGTLGAVIRIRQTVPNRKALFDIGIAGPLAGFAVMLPVLAAGVVTATPAPPTSADGGTVFVAPPLFLLFAKILVGPLPAGGWEWNPFLLASWLGAFATAINLFPSGQLDGGHVCYALSRRLQRFASRFTLLALAGLLAWATLAYHSPVWLVWVVFIWVMGARHPWLADESAPLSTGRKVVAVIGLAVFLLSFTPIPIVA